MNRQRYLKRINFTGNPDLTIEALRRLQKLHLLHVPFENLDIHSGKKIEPENSYDKIVNKGRGGFCYELNRLFFTLLKDIGFSVCLISARVYDRLKMEFGPEFDHMAIIVELNGGEYLVDVGFGEFSFGPLNIELSTIQPDVRGNFKIEKYDDRYLLVSKEEGSSFIPEYIFTKIKRDIADFNDMCLYHQTSPDSHFTKNKLCSIPTETGRISLTDNKLKISASGKVEEFILSSEEEFNEALWKYFGIAR